MKKFLLPSFFLVVLFSCQKDEMQSLPVFNSIAPVTLSSFTGSGNGESITIEFTTSRQQDVSYYLLYSGNSTNELCPLGKIVAGSGDSYRYTDLQPKGDPTYYMISYVCKDSSYNFCEQLLQVELKKKDK